VQRRSQLGVVISKSIRLGPVSLLVREEIDLLLRPMSLYVPHGNETMPLEPSAELENPRSLVRGSQLGLHWLLETSNCSQTVTANQGLAVGYLAY